MEDCIFCKIVKGEIPCHKIYEDEKFLAFADAHPLEEGHTLVIPKKHFENFIDVDEEFGSKYIQSIQKVGKILMEKYKLKGFNILLNNGKDAGQLVNHVHFHIFPRKNDGRLLELVKK